MKKNYFLILLLFTFFTHAQVSVQGVPRNDIKQKITAKSSKKTAVNTTTFDDIKFWVGTGANRAAFAVQWNDGKNSDALVWGFRWDGEATGEDMLKAILKADARFFSLLYQGTQFGTALGGLGFDSNGKNTNGLYKNGDVKYPLYPMSGIINTKVYDFDDYTAIDPDDHWESAWYTGFWSYNTKDLIEDDYVFSGVGATSRILVDGSWDLWSFRPGFEEFSIPETFTSVTPYISSTDYTNGFYMVNEDWYGHTNGSVNFVNNDGSTNYRIYSNANDNEAFGATTQYGTIYGDKFYFISKQQADAGDNNYIPGGRLVVADVKSMKRIAKFETIGGGDGRSFLGVNEKTGYIGAANGIFLFDIDNMQVGNIIPETGGGSSYAGQIGNMIRTSQYVFAVKQSKGILVIDPKTNTVIKTIAGSFNSVVQAKDGSVWTIQTQKLINIDTVTFALTEYAIPATRYLGSWGAWDAGSFTYSNQQNALYWINSVNSFVSGSQIIKFDIASKTFNENFAAIPGQTGTYKQVIHGAGLRIDPVSDNLIINTTESGGLEHYQKNWIHTFNNTGTLINTRTLNDYYWFPAVTVFPDNASPVINTTLPSQVTMKDPVIIDLKTVVSDVDNLSVAIVKSVKSNSDTGVVSAVINSNDELVLTPNNLGNATIVVSFNSNGKLVEKAITVNVTNGLGTGDFKKLKLAIYPNPVSETLNIQTEDEIVSVTVYDVTGKTINTSVTNNQINVNNLINGLYIINVVTDKANYTQKFIKK